MKNYDVIIVDDNSSDWNIKNKLKNLFKYYNQDFNLTIIFNKNNYGLSRCRNIAIDYSNSEWILPLDSDDLIDKKFLEKSFKQLNLIKLNINNSLDYDFSNIIISSNAYRFYNREEDDRNGYINKVDIWKIPKWSSEQLINTNLLHCTTIFKKSLWKSIGGYDESLWFGWEDWDFWLRTNQYFKKNENHLFNDFKKSIYQQQQQSSNIIINKFKLNEINPIILEENLFYYRVKKEGLHSFCKVNFKLCFSLFQTLHPSIYSIEDILISHKYIGRNGLILKDSLSSQIKKYPNNSMNYFWLSLIKHYGNNGNHNKFEIINLYKKSIDLEIYNINNNNDIFGFNNNNNNNYIWQFELHKLLIELETIHLVQAKKDLQLFFKKYNNLNLNDKINRLYHLNI